MQQKISQFTTEVTNFAPNTTEELEDFRIKFLGTKGLLKDLFNEFKTTAPENKQALGKILNEFKQLAESTYSQFKEKILDIDHHHSNSDNLDLTLPSYDIELGSRHPLSLVRKEIIEIFKRIESYIAF